MVYFRFLNAKLIANIGNVNTSQPMCARKGFLQTTFMYKLFLLNKKEQAAIEQQTNNISLYY